MSDDQGDYERHTISVPGSGEGGGFLALTCLLFFLGCMLTGFYTMVLYAISTVYHWQRIVCPTGWPQ